MQNHKQIRQPPRAAWLTALALFGAGLLPPAARADLPELGAYEATQAKLQATYIWQSHGGFGVRPPAGLDASKYAGSNPVYSLGDTRDKSYTATITGYFGFRPWQGGELYLDPEITQGVPFTGGLVGMGGFYNGEITRAAGSTPKLYRQRLFLRQTWNMGGGSEAVESDLNWMAGSVDKNRFVLTAGNFSTLDIFDKNRYANDPRRQFMNWGNMTHTAFDYAADARGWSWGVVGELYQGDWAYRFGRTTGPTAPNMQPMDLHIFKHYGDQAEIEHDHEIDGHPGAIRLLAYRDHFPLASYQDAIAYGNSLNWQPGANGMEYILDVRSGEKVKYGFGLNAEQEISDKLGVYFRGMWSDGRTETYAFAEADRSLAVGAEIKGGYWGRGDDTVGISLLENFLGRDRRQYLALGGISFFIGDGWLNYRPEQIVESYYSWNVARNVWLTADVQRIRNPAYNADRGPVNIAGFRFHTEI